MNNATKIKYKMPLIGNSMVGKTSIAERLVRGTFNNYKDSTIGAAYWLLRKEDVEIDLWDTAGQERYLSLVQFYLRNADLILFVLDVTNLNDSFERVEFYMNHMNNCKNIIVIGNKVDALTNFSIEEIEKNIKKNF
jgi:Ras-related protein Rab-5C